ncbi:ribonuclease H-like domain-containing protein, partial [Tanacetum coccineum]
MTENKAYLVEYQDYNGGPIAFGGSKGQITGKGKIITRKLDFEDVYFVKELKQFNLFSVSQMCDKKNKVLFTDSECLACLIAKATVDESNKWHRRLGHVNFKNLNKLMKGNLVREFKNMDIIEFCGSKGIKREYSNARTPQQNRVAERKNRHPYEESRTMLARSFLPNTFWAEAVSTACYVLNRLYKTFLGAMFTILNIIDHWACLLEKSFMKGFSWVSLQARLLGVYNLETKRVEENLHITFLENKPNVAGRGPTWLFDLYYLTDSMNYHPVKSENQANIHAGQQKANHHADEKREGPREEEQVFLDELKRFKRQEKEANEEAGALRKEFAQETENLVIKEGAAKASSTNIFSIVSTPAKASSTNLVNTVSGHEGLSFSDPTNPEQDDLEIPPLEDIYQNSSNGIFTTSSYDDEGAVADFTNLETVVNVSPIPTSRI